jgi:hypothetical protein
MNRGVEAAAVAWLKVIIRGQNDRNKNAMERTLHRHSQEDMGQSPLQEALQPPRRLDNRNMVF